MISTKWISLTLSFLGIGGTALTSWLAVRCHEKAKDKTDKKEKVVAYGPAIASGVGTAICILGAHGVSRKEIAALSAGCAYLAANRDKLEQKIKDVFGEEALKDVKTAANAEMAKEAVSRRGRELVTSDSKKMLSHGPSVEWTGNGTIKCFEGYSGRYFYSSLEKVKEAEAKLNRRIHDGEYVSLNDFYELLGISQTHFGNTFGWPACSDYIDVASEAPIAFENTLAEDDVSGETVLLIDVYTYPMECWEEV